MDVETGMEVWGIAKTASKDPGFRCNRDEKMITYPKNTNKNPICIKYTSDFNAYQR